ncbi:MAG: iron-sulfur cluster insertion protein ErpA [Rickettsiella sp.]|nr:iron-sulfur cluster insertion protein ErpA [Rickettsiella sp.]
MAEAILQHSINRVGETQPSNQLVTMTDSAAVKVLELISEEANFQLKLRVFITGGGCSGFQYGFTFDETINPDDMVITKDLKLKEEDEEDEGGSGAVQLLIDPMSLVYLVGAEIDYKSDLRGEQFIIRNPNAKTTCGCGSSFAA